MNLLTRDGENPFNCSNYKLAYPNQPELNWIKINCSGNKEFGEAYGNEYNYIFTEPHTIKFNDHFAIIKDSRGHLRGVPITNFYWSNDPYFDEIINKYSSHLECLDKIRLYGEIYNYLMASGCGKIIDCPVCYGRNCEIVDYHLYCYYCAKNISLDDYYVSDDWNKEDLMHSHNLICHDCAKEIIEYDLPKGRYKQSFFFGRKVLKHIKNGKEIERVTQSQKKAPPRRKGLRPPPYMFPGYRPPGRMP